MINNSAYHNSDEHKDEINHSDKKVQASKEPITDTHVCNTSVEIVSVKPAAVGVGIIGKGGRGITQVVIKNKHWYLYLKVGYKDMIGTVVPVLIVGKLRTVFLLV